MATSLSRKLFHLANGMLAPTGFELIRRDRKFQNYIPLGKTLTDAEKSGLSLGEYIDSRFNVRGTTQTTIDKWRKWLVQTYHVIPMETDRTSLSSTSSDSMDLVHTHKVLYGNPIITICNYLAEMSRVVRKGGYVVFDLLTEGCLTDEYVEKWISSGADHACSIT